MRKTPCYLFDVTDVGHRLVAGEINSRAGTSLRRCCRRDSAYACETEVARDGGKPGLFAFPRPELPCCGRKICLPRTYPILSPVLVGLFLASRYDGTRPPRCRTKALDQKIYEDLHLGRLMTARRQQSVQRVGLRILCVLQQELQQPLMDGARHHVFA